MTNIPYTEEELTKEIDRLYKEVIQLMTYEPSKEEVSKRAEQIYKDIEEGIFRHSKV